MGSQLSSELKIEKIRRLVGPITEKQLRYVDSFVGDHISLFMPVGGACFFARTPLHSHPSYLFILAFDGHTRLSLDGKIISSRPRKILALSPGIRHHELDSDLPPRYVAIFIDRIFFKQQLSHYPVEQDIRFRGDHCDAPPGLLPPMKRFMVEADAGLPGAATVLHGLSIEICHLLIRSVFRIARVGRGIAGRPEIDRVVEYLHHDPGCRITVKEMAERACMSLSHFSRTFKKELGVPPMTYLLRMRLHQAKKLLAAGDKSITEIALVCGFSSASHFSACFRREFKISPAQFRNDLA